MGKIWVRRNKRNLWPGSWREGMLGIRVVLKIAGGNEIGVYVLIQQ